MLAPLNELLKEPIASVVDRQQHTLERLLSEHHNRVVLFGAGTLGKRAIALFRGIGVEPLAVTDNSKSVWGGSCEGCPILSPEDAARRFGADAIFLITVWNDHHWYRDTFAMLTAYGCRSVSSYAPIFWRFPDTFLTLLLLNELPVNLFQDAHHVQLADDLWADELSTQIYRANIHWRALGDASHLPGPPAENTYFPADIFSLSDHEVLLDCGAFNGDTIRQVLQRRGSGFDEIHSIEADAVSFQNLKQEVCGMAPDVQSKIHLKQCAVGSERTTVRFASSGSLTSKICDTAEDGVEVECFPIDDLFSNAPITMIKMDIEGAEYGALMGARNTIQRDKPLLAICVYHTQSDIWRIPLLIHELLPEHKLYLRAYEGDGFQTVTFAVPPHRVLNAQ